MCESVRAKVERIISRAPQFSDFLDRMCTRGSSRFFSQFPGFLLLSGTVHALPSPRLGLFLCGIKNAMYFVETAPGDLQPLSWLPPIHAAYDALDHRRRRLLRVCNSAVDLVVLQPPANVREEGVRREGERGERTTRVKSANEAPRAEGTGRAAGRRSARTRRGGGGERRTTAEAP